MHLSQLLTALPSYAVSGCTINTDTDITKITNNSRTAAKGALFVAVVGETVDGHNYISSAYDKGARVFVVEHAVELPFEGCTFITVTNARIALAQLSAEFYGHPADKLKIVGITGTKGKTTTSLMIRNMLISQGENAGYIGTNGIIYGNVCEPSPNSTPESLELQYHMRNMVNAGVKYLIMEVSSQALKMNRVYGISFDICVFTNLSRDHIGPREHKDMAEYITSKQKLFKCFSPTHIVTNADDPMSEAITSVSNATLVTVTTDPLAQAPDYFISDIASVSRTDILGMSFSCTEKGEKKVRDIVVPIPGIFSVYNAVEALAVCKILGFGIESFLSFLPTLKISGRFETVVLSSQPNVRYIIDYAHNGASMEALLSAVKSYRPSRLICLFGSVGGRTQIRRQELGMAVSKYSDIAIITSDNPDFEEPIAIMNDISEHIDKRVCKCVMIEDRKEAIKYAFKIAEDGDMIILAGKGHEAYQLINGKKIPFSEKTILEECNNSLIIAHDCDIETV